MINMKSLRQFILEEYNEYRVKNLEVPYNINIKNKGIIIFKVPEIYSEDDFQIYIQDLYLKDMPGDDSLASDFFGKNAENIFDVVFEYDKYEKSEEINEKDFIDFDTNYDDNKINKDSKFGYVKLTNFKYIIKFDEFDLKDESIENIHQTLIEIFKTCESSEQNKWPLDITLDEKNIKYK